MTETATPKYLVFEAILPEDRGNIIYHLHRDMHIANVGEVQNRHGHKDWELFHRLYQGIITLHPDMPYEEASKWLRKEAEKEKLLEFRILEGDKAQNLADVIRRSTRLTV